MIPLDRTEPKQFVVEFFTDCNDEVVHGAGDPGRPAMDRCQEAHQSTRTIPES